jgi:hypothetical protein
MAAPAVPHGCTCRATAGVVGLLGSTYTGHYYDMPALDQAVGGLNKRHGWEVGACLWPRCQAAAWLLSDS